MNKFGIDFHDMEYGDLIKHVEESIRALRLRAYREGYKQGRFDEKIKGSGSEQYQQQRRDEIVERAKRDVERLIARGYDRNSHGGNEGSPIYKAYFYSVDFVVNKEKRTVVALVRCCEQDGSGATEVKERGITKCHPDDCFNVHIGKAIALRRALGLEVPDDYLNAPQPTVVRVGDVVEMQFVSFFTKKLVTDKINPINECETTIESATKYFAEGMAKIIDDSREEVAETE